MSENFSNGTKTPNKQKYFSTRDIGTMFIFLFFNHNFFTHIYIYNVLTPFICKTEYYIQYSITIKSTVHMYLIHVYIKLYLIVFEIVCVLAIILTVYYIMFVRWIGSYCIEWGSKRMPSLPKLIMITIHNYIYFVFLSVDDTEMSYNTKTRI